MPLMMMSPNVQKLESPSRKRSHVEYSETEMPSEPDVAVGGKPIGLMVQELGNQPDQEIKMESLDIGK